MVETPLPGAPDPAQIELAKPDVEIWRAQSESPQIPPRRNNHLEQAYVTGTEPVWLRVQFDPLAARQDGVRQARQGITLDPPVTLLTVSPGGECLILAQIANGLVRSHIIFYCEGVKTVLPVVQASLAKVEEKEAETGGGH